MMQMMAVVPVEQREHQHHEGQREEPSFLEHLAQRRDSVLGQRSDAIARGLQVGLGERGDVVERGRHQGDENDIGVRNLQELGHQESRRSHHRRSDLPAGGRHRLEGAGDLGREAGLAHERNRDDPDGCDVGYRVAGDRAEHADATTAILAEPPRVRPMRAAASWVNHSEPPVRISSWPNWPVGK